MTSALLYSLSLPMATVAGVLAGAVTGAARGADLGITLTITPPNDARRGHETSASEHLQRSSMRLI